jgi:DNA-binding NarL/FixJ family response regulator
VTAVTTLVLGEFPDLIAYGLRGVLAEDDRLQVLASDVPIDSLEAALAETEPDVALIDLAALHTPIQVHQLREAQPETQLVVLVERASAAECSQLLAFGATAVLARDTRRADLLTALGLASRGMHVLPGSDGAVAPEPYGPELLTPREAEVLELLQLGAPNAEIAARLHVGVETVRTHVRNIYRKLGVTSRRELAAAPGAARTR